MCRRAGEIATIEISSKKAASSLWSSSSIEAAARWGDRGRDSSEGDRSPGVVEDDKEEEEDDEEGESTSMAAFDEDKEEEEVEDEELLKTKAEADEEGSNEESGKGDGDGERMSDREFKTNRGGEGGAAAKGTAHFSRSRCMGPLCKEAAKASS